MLQSANIKRIPVLRWVLEVPAWIQDRQQYSGTVRSFREYCVSHLQNCHWFTFPLRHITFQPHSYPYWLFPLPTQGRYSSLSSLHPSLSIFLFMKKLHTFFNLPRSPPPSPLTPSITFPSPVSPLLFFPHPISRPFPSIYFSVSISRPSPLLSPLLLYFLH